MVVNRPPLAARQSCWLQAVGSKRLRFVCWQACDMIHTVATRMLLQPPTTEQGFPNDRLPPPCTHARTRTRTHTHTHYITHQELLADRLSRKALQHTRHVQGPV